MKIWVTKYALTRGILIKDAEVKENSATVRDRYPAHFHNDDFHLTEEAALACAERMRLRKIESLNKQLAKLTKLKVSVRP